MSRIELALEVYKRLPKKYRTNENKQFINKILGIAIDVMKESLMSGELLKFKYFGTLKPLYYPSKPTWSHTKKRMIDSRPFMKVNFLMSRSFKDAAKKMLWEEKGGQLDG